MNTSIIRSIGFNDPDAKVEIHFCPDCGKEIHRLGPADPKTAAEKRCVKCRSKIALTVKS